MRPCCDLFRLPISFDSHKTMQHIAHWPVGGISVGINWPWLDGVDGDPTRSKSRASPRAMPLRQILLAAQALCLHGRRSPFTEPMIRCARLSGICGGFNRGMMSMNIDFERRSISSGIQFRASPKTPIPAFTTRISMRRSYERHQ